MERPYLERFFAEYQNDYLTIPAAPELRFFGAQKNAYDHLSNNYFSYSGPTSMGKSFLMRMYIKDQIQHGVQMNFALIVPTKALINEIYKQIIDEDLKSLLSEHNYKVVTAAGDIALEGLHNFILVLTPERLLYLLISKPDLQIDYLFIDEAHKLSGKNSRGPFYYIRNNKDTFIIEGLDGKWHLSTALLKCSNINARTEALSVRYNMPELFVAG